MSSRLLGGIARPSVVAAAQDERIPIYTYLMNAGLSPQDVREVGDAVWGAVKRRLMVTAAADTPEQQRRYMTDKSYRKKVNEQIFGEELMRHRFSRGELKKIDEGLGLGLVPKERTRKIARTVGPHGELEDFEFLEDPELKPGVAIAMRSLKTGDLFYLAPDGEVWRSWA